MTKGMKGIFVGDAGCVSKKLQDEFSRNGERIFFVKPKKTMRKIMTWWQKVLCDTRMRIELNLRSLKLFFGLVTSLPRSPEGYFANYIYSLLAYAVS
jgi:hypothetical protein